MAKFQQVTVPNARDYSDWIQPAMESYKMGCCDCGLVHDLEFRVVEVTKDLGDGYKEVIETDNQNLVVQFRTKRNNRSTGQLRRRRESPKMEIADIWEK